MTNFFTNIFKAHDYKTPSKVDTTNEEARETAEELPHVVGSAEAKGNIEGNSANQ
jgi:hypothetical protein